LEKWVETTTSSVGLTDSKNGGRSKFLSTARMELDSGSEPQEGCCNLVKKDLPFYMHVWCEVPDL
jgi:hypothetical protein